jgi:predicted HicB family RNase H-like nuclease
MNNTIKYKGFTAKIEFSADDNVFFGRLLGVDDIVSFHAENVEDLNKEMKETVDFYIETCEKFGKSVKKTFNGKLLFRFSSELHAKIVESAARRGKSVNEFGREIFETAIEKSL